MGRLLDAVAMNRIQLRAALKRRVLALVDGAQENQLNDGIEALVHKRFQGTRFP